MKNKILLILISLFSISFFSKAQNNFTLSPQKPKPGDVISFTYKAPEGFATEQMPLRCDAYKFGFYEEQMKYGAKPLKCELIKLTKKGDVYTGQVRTDPETRFLAFAFTVGNVVFKYVSGKTVLGSGKVDTHNDEGYSTVFYDNNEKELSHSNLLGAWYYTGNFFNNLHFSNVQLARKMYEREIEIDSTSRFMCKSRIIQMLSGTDPAEAKKIAQAEIERAFQNGLKTEEDYQMVGGSFFYFAGYPNANRYFSNLGKEKFGETDGLLGAIARKDKFYNEKDFDKKFKMVDELEQFYKTAPWNTRFFSLAASNMTPGYFFKIYLADLAKAGRVDELKALIKRVKLFAYYYAGIVEWRSITDTLVNKKDPAVLDLLNDQMKVTRARWESLKANPDQPSLDPSEDCLTTANRMKEVIWRFIYLQNQYAKYYYNTADYKKGLAYAKDAFKLVDETDFEFSGSLDIATIYLQLTEKLSPKDCKGLIEKFIAADLFIPEWKAELKKIYVDEHKSEEGFAQYYTGLRKSSAGAIDTKSFIASLQVNEKAPAFSLTDLQGNIVSLESLKGKTVILDFWATWCGPCIASFPAMSKLQDAYKNNKDVVFLFINTWERDFKTNEELKQRVVDFVTKRKYDFHVLLDAQSNASSDFGVSGIPTKILIDKEGRVRYKISSGETDEDKLIEEINLMVESVK